MVYLESDILIFFHILLYILFLKYINRYVNGCAFPSLITDWNGTPAANAVPGILIKTKRNKKRQKQQNK